MAATSSDVVLHKLRQGLEACASGDVHVRLHGASIVGWRRLTALQALLDRASATRRTVVVEGGQLVLEGGKDNEALLKARLVNFADWLTAVCSACEAAHMLTCPAVCPDGCRSESTACWR